ncbi:MAG: alcohol dehydrogenase catalytic domain-containing protein [Armatimonadetes bacterium]|nr:alcohol dehydrogenase catalytic domain-containing protein [Armatimonadota bacterium]
MRAVRFYAPKDVRLMDVPTPEPRPGDVVCRVARAGICGTDYSIYSGEASFIGMVRFPMTPGHEWSGIVESVGSDVKGLQPGDRVVGDTAVSCGMCYECLMGQYNHCKELRAVGTVLTWDGGWAEYILMPARHMFRLPDGVSFDNGALVEPVATGLLSLMLTDMQIGDTVLVQGTGPIGIAAAKLAKLHGASKVIITGRKDYKLDLSLTMGIDNAINVTREPLGETVRALVGAHGVDRVIEASGSTELFKESIGLTRPGGVMSVVAFYDKPLAEFNIDSLVFGDVTIKPVPGSLGMFKPVLRLMESGMLDMSSIITHRCTLEQAAEALKEMKTNNDTKIKIMIEMEA